MQPENLLYEEEENESLVKICDFGVAKVLEDKQQLMSTYCGTHGYQAPEILKNQKYDCACDIWSLGIVVYVMLCGYPPFDSESNEENHKNIVAGKFKFPSPDWDKVSDKGTLQ